MSDSALFWAGCLVSLLCLAFFAFSYYELRRLGVDADKERGEWREWR